ncbi:MAG: hypothetical protein CVU84_15390 [Firmicutes bacterium HGW-Firmicutes-1]|jgi:two-component system sensor histidine kinase AtoS|nr:MAG: hypothetical protein CVU84_15390 [Firmicutes bacterium HGW-Firmicutes-1]
MNMEDLYNKSMGLACAKIAHEIKNPIAIIASTLQLIEIQFPDVKKNKHWHKLYSELDFISTLLNDFNKLSNSEDFDFALLDLGELISEVADRFEPFAIQNQVELNLVLPDDIYNVNGDEIKLMEAFTNLLKNAVEAVSMCGRVLISLSIEGTYVVATVEDNGSGIDEDKLSSIFLPFVSYKDNGTGLGLPIVASIINKHSGILDVISSLNNGTKFIIKLPLHPF